MERKRINTLYSMLINIDDRMIYENYFTDMMNMNLVFLNEKKITPKEINMTVYVGDKIKFKETEYLVNEDKLEQINS